VFIFLLVIQALIAATLVAFILVQKSEGGGLTGGSPSGLMSARGSADFLTRGTAILASLFVAMSILLAVLASQKESTKIDTTLAKPGGGVTAQAPAPAPSAAPVANNAAPASNSAVPLAQ
jgi:preprotein translocase subunit SecG